LESVAPGKEESRLNWLGFSLMALILWGVWGFLSKAATHYLPSQAVYLLAITGHVVVVVYLLLRGQVHLPWQPLGLALGLGAGLAMAFGLLTFLLALSRGPAAVIVPLTALYPAVTVILSAVLLGEELPPQRLVGLVLALAAAWLLSR
jgi:bacterial/archaeal transporter family protein